MKSILRNGTLIFICLLIATTLSGYLWLQTSLPKTTGTTIVEGLEADVEIIRDENGVPHIFAETKNDAAFALGYAHAQDRLWQMEFMRRIGAGRLSEVIGRETLDSDKFLRTLGLYRLSERQAERLSDVPNKLLSAYASGVNAFLSTHWGAWPIEYVLLNFSPEPWRPADSLVWAKIMAFQLSVSWRGDLMRAKLVEKVGADRLRRLFPLVALDKLDKISKADKKVIDALSTALPELLVSDSASNAWVIDGSHTTTGKPILANDPHLGFSAPGLWYLARISVGERTWTGATVPGVPLLILGQNGDIAWGMTTTGGDTSDIFIEVLAVDPRSYITPEGPKRFRTRTETIFIDGEEPVRIAVRESRHGPILSDIIPRLSTLGGEGRAIALAATALNPDDYTVTALYNINQARNLSEFREAISGFGTPMQNLFVADRHGNIGYSASGRMPIRKHGAGHLPSRGDHGRGAWRGYIDPSQWPQSWNPTSGLIANANNRLTDKRGISYAWYWPESHRVTRIHEAFLNAPPRDIDGQTRLQMDDLSEAARLLIPLMIRIKPVGALSEKALNLIRGWDYKMDRDRPEPLIYAAWIRHLMKTLLSDDLGDAYTSFSRARPYLIWRVLSEDAAWCDDITTELKEDCVERVQLALALAVDELGRKYGDEPTAWRWGDAHVAVFENQILRHIPVLAGWAEGRIATNGGDQTINRGQTRGRGKMPYRHSHGPGYRAVYDLNDPRNSRFSLATGQSGNPFSPHYMDQLTAWRDGRYLRITGSRAELKNRGGERLWLKPAGN
ncbi:MAG: penicillin acylase family protein [Pseudomonadota bacterium]|nr:penicillin acylase family protein [Pseudomonadota bacterium]